LFNRDYQFFSSHLNQRKWSEMIDSINALLPRAILMIGLLKKVFHILMWN